MHDGNNFLEAYGPLGKWSSVPRGVRRLSMVADGQFILTIGNHFSGLRKKDGCLEVNHGHRSHEWQSACRWQMGVPTGFSEDLGQWLIDPAACSGLFCIEDTDAPKAPGQTLPVEAWTASQSISSRTVRINYPKMEVATARSDCCWCEINAPFDDTVVIELGHNRLGRPNDVCVAVLPALRPERLVQVQWWNKRLQVFLGGHRIGMLPLQDCDVQQWAEDQQLLLAYRDGDRSYSTGEENIFLVWWLRIPGSFGLVDVELDAVLPPLREHRYPRSIVLALASKDAAYGRMMHLPSNNVPDSVLWHYRVQVNIYAWILRKYYDINVT
ncbi:Ba71V-079 [Symbiodinium microadriaticum]|nr:Ba71V-079 [Symbiodinium microadriaticum]CAE7942789.1 Ba71V-079 [Symbiodinium sp. KB8]